MISPVSTDCFEFKITTRPIAKRRELFDKVIDTPIIEISKERNPQCKAVFNIEN